MYLDDLTRSQLIGLYRGQYPELPPGSIGQDDPLKLLAQQEKTALLAYLEACLIAKSQEQQAVFGQLVYAQNTAKLSPDEVIAAVKQVHTGSLAGKYYAPFSMNSKNYDWVPPETEAWFDEISIWLDRYCELAAKGHSVEAKQGLDLLMELIRKMNDGDEIVFAHEYGDWMIFAQYDYLTVYKQLS